MRKLVAAIMALSGIGIVSLAGSSPAMAYDYPWCVQGRGVGVPRRLLVRDHRAVPASASGRNLYCNINPRVAFRRPPPAVICTASGSILLPIRQEGGRFRERKRPTWSSIFLCSDRGLRKLGVGRTLAIVGLSRQLDRSSLGLIQNQMVKYNDEPWTRRLPRWRTPRAARCWRGFRAATASRSANWRNHLTCHCRRS